MREDQLYRANPASYNLDGDFCDTFKPINKEIHEFTTTTTMCTVVLYHQSKDKLEKNIGDRLDSRCNFFCTEDPDFYFTGKTRCIITVPPNFRIHRAETGHNVVLPPSTFRVTDIQPDVTVVKRFQGYLTTVLNTYSVPTTRVDDERIVIEGADEMFTEMLLELDDVQKHGDNTLIVQPIPKVYHLIIESQP